MSLNRLTVRAKKSLSDLFSLGNTDGFASLVAHHARSGQIMLTTIRDSPGETVACNKENDVPDPEEFGSCPCSKSSTFSNLKNHSPDKNSPSKCKRLIGSLRRISSLRSIRMSPNRTKEYELSHTTPPEGPRTPTRYVRNSLALNFKESPPDQPMFDIPKPRLSTSSSLVVNRSSPIAISLPARQPNSFSTPVNPSILPAGTIPTSPAPIQIALEMDPTSIDTFPILRPVVEPSAMNEPMSTPMPGTSLSFEDIKPNMGLDYPSSELTQEHLGYFDLLDKDGYKVQSKHENLHIDSGAARKASAGALPILISGPDSVDTTNEDSIQPIGDARNFVQHRRANGKTIAHSDAPRSRTSSSADSILENINNIVWDRDGHTAPDATSEMIHDILAESSTTSHSIADSEVGSPRQLSAWHTHTGLYDGTGYGEDSQSTLSCASLSNKEASGVLTATKCQCVHTDVESNADTAPSSPASDDQHALGMIIRAYAGLEAEGKPSSLDGDYVEDLELANRMMNHSLGA